MTTVTSATATTAAAKAKTGTGIGADFNTFLGLLTTQLKNQDPTKAMDTQEMTNQLVQFASVEQQISMNGNLDKLIGLQQAAQLTAAAPLMGKVVEVASDRIALQGGTGTTDWVWDGRNAAGQRQPDGGYRIAVVGRDKDGAPQEIAATVVARATAAERAGGGDLKLVLGGISVGFDAVRSLGQ